MQLELGFPLGPPDGRYLVRPEADAPLEAILVLATLAAPRRRLLRGRRGQPVERADPEPVPTARVTVIRPEPFRSRERADAWLAELRGSPERADAELAAATLLLARALHAHRIATADPQAAESGGAAALVARVGYGAGEAVADGRFVAAWELPRASPRRRTRSMAAPDDRFAAILGGRERAMPAEALLLRARADLDTGRAREAALQARVALESLLVDLPAASERLENERPALAEAANAALAGELPGKLHHALVEAVARMEAELRRRLNRR